MDNSSRKEYAQRAMTSNIFDGVDQPRVQHAVPAQQISTVFEAEYTGQSNALAPNAAPAPYLTDLNAVDTCRRRGGMVNKYDNLMEASVETDAPTSPKQTNGTYREAEVRIDVTPKEELKKRNYESDIFNRNEGVRPVETDNNAVNDNGYLDSGAIALGHKQRQMKSKIFDTPSPQTKTQSTYDRATISNIF